jgi:putative FmdB family regulatory protein
MPLYDYQCASCWHAFEMRQAFDADPRATCPNCQGVGRRKFNAVPVIYKGSGFYTTDYGRGSRVGSPEGKD